MNIWREASSATLSPQNLRKRRSGTTWCSAATTTNKAINACMQRVVKNAIEDLKAGKVPLEDLEYQVEVHEDPLEKKGEKVLHQPYQCAVQLIDSGKLVEKRSIVCFVKVKPFQYRGRTFTVKPTEHARGFHEVNVDDYVRNLRTALNQTFKPMNIRFREDEERKVTLTGFL